MSGTKAGAGAAGLLAVLGLGLARNVDSCASAGVRGSRAVGELGEGAVVGSRAVWGVDDATRLGGRVEAEMPGAAVGRALPEAGGSARALEAGHGRIQPGDIFDFSFDVALETIDLVETGDEAWNDLAIPDSGGTKCPRLIDATEDDSAWSELLGGLGIACAPLVVVGVQGEDEDALRLGLRTETFALAARACARAGGHCLLVACPPDDTAACLRATEHSHLGTRLTPDLFAYERALVHALLTQDPAPTAIASVDARGDAPRLRIARP